MRLFCLPWLLRRSRYFADGSTGYSKRSSNFFRGCGGTTFHELKNQKFLYILEQFIRCIVHIHIGTGIRKVIIFFLCATF